MKIYEKYATSNDIFLYAQNDGRFYKTHCNLATAKVNDRIWYNHVKNVILPAYEKEFPNVAFILDEVFDSASLLNYYYKNHVKDL
jgi:hypothetical protein